MSFQWTNSMISSSLDSFSNSSHSLAIEVSPSDATDDGRGYQREAEMLGMEVRRGPSPAEVFMRCA